MMTSVMTAPIPPKGEQYHTGGYSPDGSSHTDYGQWSKGPYMDSNWYPVLKQCNNHYCRKDYKSPAGR